MKVLVTGEESPYCGEVHLWDRWPVGQPLPSPMEARDIPMCGRCFARWSKWLTYGINPLPSEKEVMW